jgi:hypothetical protein
MSIIVSILGFMMDTGSWVENKTFIAGFTNPIYIPQLAFRTPLALLMAGAIGLFLTKLFTKNGSSFQQDSTKKIALWMLLMLPFTLAGALAYYFKIPELMIETCQ